MSSGCLNAFWLWLPVLIFKAVSAVCSTVWKFHLWGLQTICGVPLYYCKPHYRIPGIFFGTVGAVFTLMLAVALMAMSSSQPLQNQPRGDDLIVFVVMGPGLVFLCRFLIRRGSI